MASRERWVGVCYATFSVLLFSGFTLASRAGLSTRLRPADVAAFRFGIGGILLTPVLVRHGLKGIRGAEAFALAFFGGFGFAFFAYMGFWLAPATHGSVLLHGTIPIFTQLLSGTSASNSHDRRTAGNALIAIGVVAMVYDSVAAARVAQIFGDGFLLVASLLWSAYGIRVRRSSLTPAHAASVVAVLSMTCFLPVYVAFFSHDVLLTATIRLVLIQTTVQGVLVGAVSIFVYTRAVSILGPAVTSLFTAAVPCLTTLAAIPLLSEIPSRVALSGVAIMTVGMTVALRSRNAER